ncbi:hypothetical protein [Microcoleus phage My-WqHQDG]|nr:hypothetical protein [Microcoleus phage My-WqHQDG]
MATNYESLDTLKGKVLEAVTRTRDAADDGPIETLTFTDGTAVTFYHEQDCCEYVRITHHRPSTIDDKGYEAYYGLELESITLDATDASADNNDSATETVVTYKFVGQRSARPAGGSRSKTKLKRFKTYWLGESNGYYSEGVSYQISMGEGSADLPTEGL